MYNEYFGFKEAPFSIAPDPHYLYMTTQHREALAHLVYGLNSEGGCILLTGEVGTGKTTICRCLLEQIPELVNVALVLNPKVSEIELLESICDELKISYPDISNRASNNVSNSVKTYIDRIYDFLLSSNRNNEKTVLIIDEAQNLSSEVLEQLRLLTNLETNQRKLLQIIILGQPELLDILSRPEMRQLAQRITARFHLRPLSKHEVKAYVSHRLAVAGQNIQLFPDKSIKLLYRLSNGIPRLINILCDRALLGAYVENQYAVNPATIKKAAKEVFGELKNVEQHKKNKQWLYPLAAFVGIVVIPMAIIFYYINTDDSTTNLQAIVLPETQFEPLSLNTEDKNKLQKALKDTETLSTYSAQPSLSSSVKQNSKENTAISLPSNKKVESLNTTVTAVDEMQAVAISTDTAVDNIDTILNTKNNNRTAAYQQLFNAWDRHYKEKTSKTACQQAATQSLSCLFKRGNINSLKAHNRPAVLTLINKQGKTRHVTITAIDNDIATLYVNNTAYKIKLNELDKYWYGQFILLWKKPDYYLAAISPGDSGAIVNWLNTQLEKINKHLPERIISTYDDTLLERVIAFQSQNGLTADGIVGPVTIIHINTQSGMRVPSLIPLPTLQSAIKGF
jgi:general secretion pathway protein A